MSAFEKELLASLEAGEGDVTVTARDGRTLRAQSSILQICSPVLRAELTGPMQEATTRQITMDCEHAEARAFLQFIYIGHLTEEHFGSLDTVIALVRLSDFYGVVQQLGSSFGESSNQQLFRTLLDTSLIALDDPSRCAAEVLVKLRPVIAVQKSITDNMLASLGLRFGRNVYRYLCHASAWEDELAEVGRECRRVMQEVRLAGDDVLSGLQAEVNAEVVAEIVSIYPTKPATAVQAFLQFTSLCSGIYVACGTLRPATGATVRLRDGSEARLVQYEHSDKTCFVQEASGIRRWVSDQEAFIQNPILEILSRLAEVVQTAVSNAEQQQEQQRHHHRKRRHSEE